MVAAAERKLGAFIGAIKSNSGTGGEVATPVERAPHGERIRRRRQAIVSLYEQSSDAGATTEPVQGEFSSSQATVAEGTAPVDTHKFGLLRRRFPKCTAILLA